MNAGRPPSVSLLMTHSTGTRSPRPRLALLALVVLALALALTACSSDSEGGASSGVTIKDLKFTTEPVSAGASVTVQNNDDVTHTVTADDGGFDVSVEGGKSATFTAPATAGAYKFHCNIHPTMQATLTVQ